MADQLKWRAEDFQIRAATIFCCDEGSIDYVVECQADETWLATVEGAIIATGSLAEVLAGCQRDFEESAKKFADLERAASELMRKRHEK